MSLYSVLTDSNVFTYEYFQQEDVCRLCWNRNAERVIISRNIEKSCNIKNDLLDKVRYCLNIDISLSDTDYPNKACENCFGQLEKFHDFKFFCNENDKKLREIILNKIDDKSVHATQNSCIKVEKNESACNYQTSEYNDSYLDHLHNLDVTSESETLQKHEKNRKSRIKSKYKPIRTPTYCNICRIDLDNIDNFSNHNSLCHGIEDGGLYKCFGCEKRFKSRKTRLGHEINFCKGLKDGYQCSICDRYLPKRRVYENHMRNHRDNVPVELPDDIFKCLKCYKLFNTKTNLKKHMAVHDGEKKNFVCESCGRVFTRQDYLHKHKLTHTGVKQHVCPHCGFRTTQRSSLTVHIRKHTGERPYSCDVCPQRCVSSSNLRAHRRRHLGVKKYECTICSKKFGYKISLDEHVASTHERSQSHPCQHCGAVYTRIRGLRRHLLAKHGKGKDDEVISKIELSKNGDDTTNLHLKVFAENHPSAEGVKVDSILKDAVKDMEPDFALKTQEDGVYIV
ncbi:unnamed protein product [Parnassius apollo]|uniref:(apollo) hypothetical protein n=1 Tax=Parnassius apollo TaxID=110799 RepID=A0A8S3XV14_PARAO|nr:unnamed protein product [Parnassius apollo]